MIVHDSTTGGYLAGPPPGASFFRKLVWLFSPPRQYYPKRPARTAEHKEMLLAQVNQILAKQSKSA